MEYYFKYEEIVDVATIHLGMSGRKFDFLMHLPQSLQDFNPHYLGGGGGGGGCSGQKIEIQRFPH